MNIEKETCVLSIVFMFLILFLLFIIYKGCCEQNIDSFFKELYRKMVMLCMKIKQPSYKYTSYSSI